MPKPKSSRLNWLLRPLAGFICGVLAGVILLGVRRVVRGDADPFNDGGPLYLQIGSLALTLLVAALSRRPFAATLGLFFGLVTYMLVDGQAEYPAAAVLALIVNGLLPAVAGALIFVLVRRFVDANHQGEQP